jgi:heme oxygenase
LRVEIAPNGLASALRDSTRALHIRAERTGVVADILNSRATRQAYALFLRNLLPAYQALEAGLDKHRMTPGVGAVALPELYRGPCIEADLVALYGADWALALPLMSAAERYADCVADTARGAGDGLAGHAYVRYLGDLSGGQILKRLLAKSLGLSEPALGFYTFPQVADIAAYKQSYIQTLDRLGSSVDREAVVAAAISAFEINIEISDTVQAMAAQSAFEPL